MFSRLRGALRPLSPEDRAIHQASRLGLKTSEPTAERSAQNAVIKEAIALIEREGMAPFRQLCFDSFASRKKMPDGTNHYAVLDSIPHYIIDSETLSPTEAEARLVPFRKAWDASDKDAFAASFYAQLLCQIGHSWRGCEWAIDVTDEGWEKLAAYTSAAQQVLYDTAASAADNPFWHRSLLKIGLLDGCSAGELDARFHAALRFDPYDIAIHLHHAWNLLPRWHGSFEELEAFARESVTRTEDKLGASLYARIYAYIEDLEDPHDTNLDWNLLRQGFEDWLALVDVDYVANIYVSMAAQCGDWETARRVFHNSVKAYVPAAWSDPNYATNVMKRLA